MSFYQVPIREDSLYNPLYHYQKYQKYRRLKYLSATWRARRKYRRILSFHYLPILIIYPYTENWMENKFIGRIIRLYLPN